jgi:GNAT superfamily N-acetyltransferase
MEIRIGTEADAESIKGLDGVAKADRPRQDSIDRWLSRGECLVAIVDEQIVAYATFNYSFYKRGFVEMVYVTKSHRRLGIASALMRTSLASAKRGTSSHQRIGRTCQCSASCFRPASSRAG